MSERFTPKEAGGPGCTTGFEGLSGMPSCMLVHFAMSETLQHVYDEILHARNTSYWNDALLEQTGFYVGISQQVPQLTSVSNPYP